MKISPKQALNKAYLKVKPSREQMDNFKKHLRTFLNHLETAQREEHHKNDLSDFLKDSFYRNKNYINIDGTIDLVIRGDTSKESPIFVMIEAKSTRNGAEMVTNENLNARAMQELVLYYLRERISGKNINVKHLIITNYKQYFIFDAIVFDKLFAQDTQLIRLFKDFEAKKLAITTTDQFYSIIAKPAIEAVKDKLDYTYFNIEDYKKYIETNSLENDSKLIELYKIFSPEHLLKLPIANDSNCLDKKFYNELLHIIGLEETKQGSKKIITRKAQDRCNSGSLLENCIYNLDVTNLDNPAQYGDNREEQLFNVGLELVITWINRILFLKLLEAQLISFHCGDKNYAFLNSNTLTNYHELNELFFRVLAIKNEERVDRVKAKFSYIPYLNSSLFEITDLERLCCQISLLNSAEELAIISGTVLKNNNGKCITGNKNSLEYLFEFLNAYDFSGDNGSEIQEEKKAIINASVLGLIFEKINGYKDGSFFTPSFITMYMCRETIRRAVVDKFNQEKSWKCKNLDDLYDKIEDRQEANELINKITLCDPAVGSGHFLVSALNEIIAIKSELKILQDRSKKRLKEYSVEVINDELVVIDEDGGLFNYNPTNKENQRIQETLFHEKQTIIENCLFGVDINPNSVKICRLRLWIELLKNAYYKDFANNELETLPNIDINIKCGNSLISRNDLHESIESILENLKHDGNNKAITVDYYRKTVLAYKRAKTKEEKGSLEKLINKVKQAFSIGFYQASLFDDDSNKKLEMEAFYTKQNAFEWRFEFPEILADNGDYKGFDIVIGNPPYIQLQAMQNSKLESDILSKSFTTFVKTGDIYALFIEQGVSLLKQEGLLSYITSNKWMRAGYGKSLREFLATKTQPISLIDFGGFQVFDSASVDSNILITQNQLYVQSFNACAVKENYLTEIPLSEYFKQNSQIMSNIGADSWGIASDVEYKLKTKIKTKGISLKDWDINIFRGVLTGKDEAFFISTETKEQLCAEDPKSAEIIKPLLRGRDIKRYQTDWAGLWLINSHNNPPINIENYPAVKNHLDKFYPQLEKRQDRGATPYNLRNCAYLAEFEKEKIAYAETMRVHRTEGSDRFPRFGFDNSHFFCNKTCFIMVGSSLKYVLSILNSSLGKYLCDEYISKLDNGGFMMKKIHIEQIPILRLPISEQQPFIDIVDKVLLAKEQQQDTTELEKQIDEMVYKLYELTLEEIAIIEEMA